MPTTYPATVADFKDWFSRDFVYGTDSHAKVMDIDITKAQSQAWAVFNPTLWADAEEKKTAFLYAAAHFLALDLQAAGGLNALNASEGANSRGGGVMNSASVGGVSVGYHLPEKLANDMVLSQLMQTHYGQRYVQMLMPRLVGPAFVVGGENELYT